MQPLTLRPLISISTLPFWSCIIMSVVCYRPPTFLDPRASRKLSCPATTMTAAGPGAGAAGSNAVPGGHRRGARTMRSSLRTPVFHDAQLEEHDFYPARYIPKWLTTAGCSSLFMEDPVLSLSLMKASLQGYHEECDILIPGKRAGRRLRCWASHYSKLR